MRPTLIHRARSLWINVLFGVDWFGPVDRYKDQRGRAHQACLAHHTGSGQSRSADFANCK